MAQIGILKPLLSISNLWVEIYSLEYLAIWQKKICYEFINHDLESEVRNLGNNIRQFRISIYTSNILANCTYEIAGTSISCIHVYDCSNPFLLQPSLMKKIPGHPSKSGTRPETLLGDHDIAALLEKLSSWEVKNDEEERQKRKKKMSRSVSIRIFKYI